MWSPERVLVIVILVILVLLLLGGVTVHAH